MSLSITALSLSKLIRYSKDFDSEIGLSYHIDWSPPPENERHHISAGLNIDLNSVFKSVSELVHIVC